MESIHHYSVNYIDNYFPRDLKPDYLSNLFFRYMFS